MKTGKKEIFCLKEFENEEEMRAQKYCIISFIYLQTAFETKNNNN